MKYIIHPGTGTIIEASDCLVLDLDLDLTDDERAHLEGDDYFDDALICTIAEERGKKFPGTDLTFSNSISFSPSALRDWALFLIKDDPEDGEYRSAIEWCIKASDDELNGIATYVLNCWDSLWEEYREAVIDGILFGYEKNKKGEKS